MYRCRNSAFGAARVKAKAIISNGRGVPADPKRPPSRRDDG
jgi:hypothetical protein